jgi:hypothetical protein
MSTDLERRVNQIMSAVMEEVCERATKTPEDARRLGKWMKRTAWVYGFDLGAEANYDPEEKHRRLRELLDFNHYLPLGVHTSPIFITLEFESGIEAAHQLRMEWLRVKEVFPVQAAGLPDDFFAVMRERAAQRAPNAGPAPTDDRTVAAEAPTHET